MKVLLIGVLLAGELEITVSVSSLSRFERLYLFSLENYKILFELCSDLFNLLVAECTGMRFAKLETVILLASIMHSLEFTTVNDQNVPYGPNDVPLPDLSQLHWRSPRKPMRIRIERRRE